MKNTNLIPVIKAAMSNQPGVFPVRKVLTFTVAQKTPLREAMKALEAGDVQHALTATPQGNMVLVIAENLDDLLILARLVMEEEIHNQQKIILLRAFQPNLRKKTLKALRWPVKPSTSNDLRKVEKAVTEQYRAAGLDV